MFKILLKRLVFSSLAAICLYSESWGATLDDDIGKIVEIRDLSPTGRRKLIKDAKGKVVILRGNTPFVGRQDFKLELNDEIHVKKCERVKLKMKKQVFLTKS